MAPFEEWAWQFMVQGKLLNSLDERLRARGGFDEEEVEKVLHLGLLCSYLDPSARPSMRQVVKVLEGKIELDGSESEDMDIHLLQKMKFRDMWFEFEQNYGSSLHLTFEDILDYYPWSSSDFSTFEDFSSSISIVFAIVNNYK